MKEEEEKTEINYRKTDIWSSLVAMRNKKGFAKEGTALLRGFLHLCIWDLVSHKTLTRKSEACVSVHIQNMVRHMALARKYGANMGVHIWNMESRMTLRWKSEAYVAMHSYNMASQMALTR
jgi:hypothetical protein